MNSVHMSQGLDPHIELLERLVVDNRDLDRLEGLLGEFNLFEAIGVERQEIRHSSFLRFLLDPSEKHGLGDYFLKLLLKRCLVGAAWQGISAIDVDVADLSDAVVETERWNIDILIQSESSRLVVAIENKVDSTEHGNQLDVYRNRVLEEFPRFRKLLIYLTPDGDPASDADNWLSMSYSTVMSTAQTVLETKSSTLGASVETALRHYEAILRKHIVADSEIAKLCVSIYRQHKEAIDIIVEHIPDLQMQMKEVLDEEVGKHYGFMLDHCTKSAVRFFPAPWDQHLCQRAGGGWTPAKRVVLFELANGRDFLRLKLVIGPADAGNPDAVSFRERVFACSEQYREDFPGGMTVLSPRFATVLSKELVKKKEYADTEGVLDKARIAIRNAIETDVRRVVERLEDVFATS